MAQWRLAHWIQTASRSLQGSGEVPSKGTGEYRTAGENWRGSPRNTMKVGVGEAVGASSRGAGVGWGGPEGPVEGGGLSSNPPSGAGGEIRRKCWTHSSQQQVPGPSETHHSPSPVPASHGCGLPLAVGLLCPLPCRSLPPMTDSSLPAPLVLQVHSSHGPRDHPSAGFLPFPGRCVSHLNPLGVANPTGRPWGAGSTHTCMPVMETW